MGPFIRDKNTTKRMMFHLLISLIPIIIFSFIKNGVIPYRRGYTNIFGMIYPLIFLLVSTGSTFLFESLFKLIRTRSFKGLLSNSYSIFPGLFLGLILPINTPIMILIAGSFVSSVIAKMLFGGFGKNIFNPALVGRLFIISVFASTIMGKGGYMNPYELDALTHATPLTNASILTGIGSYETLVRPYGRLLNIFLGNIPGALGETSALLCILAFVYLTYFKVIKWRIPATYVLTVFAMTYVIGGSNDLGIWYPLFQIFSGGLMFGAVFMATDPVTSPVTPIGQVLYGICLGILTVIFRYLTPYPEGVLTSILTMNMFVMILDKIGSISRFNFRVAIVPFIITWVLIIGLSFVISIKFDNKVEKDVNFNIVSKDVDGSKISYVVTQKGYSSTLKAKIIINNGVVEEFNILEQNDSFYQKIEDVDYVSKLKKDSDIDTVSGATITSTALKKMLSNTLSDYNNGSRENIVNDSIDDVVVTVIDDQTKEYVVTGKGFQGNIKLKVTVVGNQITSIVVLEQNDSYFNIVEENDYITKVIENQSNLSELDTVSGATFSSNGIKNAIIRVKELINE